MRILGIDYGRVRVGIALSDPLNLIASGLTVLNNSPKLISEIGELIRRYGVGIVVVGLPLTLAGGKGEMALEVERFADELAASTGVRVVRSDERFSSRQAGRTMIEMGVPKKRRREKHRVDLMASAIILQHYLDTAAAVKERGAEKTGGETPAP